MRKTVKIIATYIYLAAKGTVDEKVLKALRTKADLAKTLVDDYKRVCNPYVGGGEWSE